MAILVHFVICHAAPAVRRVDVIWSPENVIRVRAQLRTVSSVTRHAVILASTVNVTEMANVYQGVSSTTTVKVVSSCAQKTAMRQ